MTTIIAAHVPELNRTPLDRLHREFGARFAPFAGYEMPIQYQLGIMKEHLHTRAAAGLFDVSHMGQIALRPRHGSVADVARVFEQLVPIDVLGLSAGKQRYGFFTNKSGGIIDDFMIGHCGDHLLLVVNASRKAIDEEHLRTNLPEVCSVERLDDRALLALQGPAAEAALVRLAPALSSMSFLEIRPVLIDGNDCFVSRAGYTGEDGFEISVPARAAERLVRVLLAESSVTLAGLGARDSLRLEAGLCLYGADIDDVTTPAEAGLEWAIQKVRRLGGARANGFPGADVILNQIARGPSRRRVGFRSRERTPVRAGAPLFAERNAADSIGRITSGCFGPSVGGPVAMGYVPRETSALGSVLYADVRGKRVPIQVALLPFVPHQYKRT